MKWWTDMKISRKLVFAFLLLAVIPLTIFTIVAYQLSSSALMHEAHSELASVRDLISHQIEDYFAHVRNQVVTLSRSTMTVDAMKEFSTAFFTVEKELEITDDNWNRVDSRLKRYYSEEFLPRLEKGLGKKANLGDFYPSNNHTRLLQDLYIASNPHPVDSKYKLEGCDDKSTYSRIHRKYHPLFRDFQEKFGYHDLFLVEARSGNVVYSVFKDVDFATSLLDGPYKSGNFAGVFKSVIEAGADTVKLVDFKPYPPAYNSVESFIASAIADENNKVIGVLVFQMPIHKINDIMTSQNKWKELGLGYSGESYLVSNDYTIKSQSRRYAENKEGFLSKLKNTGIQANIIDEIRRVNSVIGRLPIKTRGAMAALQGKKDVDIYRDYVGAKVISAYRPLNIADLNWTIISEKEEQEALEPAHGLRTVLILIILGITAVIGIQALYIARSISRPIQAVAEDSMALGVGDLTKTVSVKSKDEIGELGMTLNRSIDQLREIVFNVKQSIVDISQTSDEIAEGGSDLASRSNQQAASVTETSAVIEEFNSAIKLSTENAKNTNSQLEEFSNEIQKKMELIDNVTRTMKEINDSGSQIDNFIGVINDISFQTNLLALNAAVEAARAGDAGRGFAVVASEVRNLAQKTAEASKNIQEIVSLNVESTGKGMDLVNQTSEFFDSIRNVMKEVSSRVQSIAESAREQENGIDQITSAIMQLEEVISQNAALAEEFSSSVSSLKGNARELESLVNRFKVDDDSSNDGSGSHLKKGGKKPSILPKNGRRNEKVNVEGRDFFREEDGEFEEF